LRPPGGSTPSSIQVVADYQALGQSGGRILGRKIVDVNIVRRQQHVTLDDGSWVLVRASSNKPEVVVRRVGSIARRGADMRALFRSEVKPRLAKFAEVGGYDPEIWTRDGPFVSSTKTVTCESPAGEQPPFRVALGKFCRPLRGLTGR